MLRDLFNILSAQSKSLSNNAKYISVQILEQLIEDKDCNISRCYESFESYFINEIDCIYMLLIFNIICSKFNRSIHCAFIYKVIFKVGQFQ